MPWIMNTAIIVVRVKTLVALMIVCFFLLFEVIFVSTNAGTFVRLYVNTPARMAIGVAKK